MRRRGADERFWATVLTRFRDYLHGTDSYKMSDGATPEQLDERAPHDPDR